MTQRSRWFWKHTRQGQFHWPWSWSRSRPYFGILLPISSTRRVPHRPFVKSSNEAGRAANRVQAFMHCFTLNASNFKELNNFCLYSSFILSWPHIHLDGDELNQWNENKLTPQTNLPQQQLYYWGKGHNDKRGTRLQFQCQCSQKNITPRLNNKFRGQTFRIQAAVQSLTETLYSFFNGYHDVP